MGGDFSIPQHQLRASTDFARAALQLAIRCSLLSISIANHFWRRTPALVVSLSKLSSYNLCTTIHDFCTILTATNPQTQWDGPLLVVTIFFFVKSERREQSGHSIKSNAVRSLSQHMLCANHMREKEFSL